MKTMLRRALGEFPVPRFLAVMLASALLASGCSGGASRAAGGVTVTLSASGCEYEGPGAIPEGQVTIRVVNATTDEGYVAMLSIEQGHTYKDLVAHAAKERSLAKAGEPALGPPVWVMVTDDGDTAPGGSSKLTAPVTSGTYGIVCALPDVSGSIWAAGSFTVSG